MSAVTVTRAPAVTCVTDTRAVRVAATVTAPGDVTTVTCVTAPAVAPIWGSAVRAGVTRTVTPATVTRHPTPKEPVMTITDTRTTAPISTRYPAVHGGPTARTVLTVFAALLAVAFLLGAATAYLT